MCHLCHVTSILVSALLLMTGCSHSPSDAVIATQIQAKFFSDSIVKTEDISVTVDKGEVTLTGTVDSVNAQLRAFKLALDTQGVRKLNDKMLVAPQPEQHRPLAQLSSPPVPDRTRAVSTPPAEAVQNTPARDQAQNVREIVRPPLPPQITVQIDAPPPPLAVVPAPSEPVPEDAALAPNPPIEIIAPPLAEPWKAPSHAPVALLAAGATAPAPLLQQWASAFQQADPQTRIDYQAIGSGGGIRLLIEGNTDLAAVEMPLTDEQLSRIPDRQILHFPAALWGIVPIFNIGGRGQPLNFSGEVLAAIFSGKITRWDHPAIRILNPNAILPPGEITVIHRSDGAGTTFVFTDYLSAVSPDWKQHIGAAPSVNWSVGLGGKGNEGVSALVQQTPNSIGYVDLSYALHNGLDHSWIQNRGGYFVKANAASLTAACANMVRSIPPDLRVSIVNAPGRDAYPIASLMWLAVPDRFSDTSKRASVQSFLRWMLTQGQSDVRQLGYAPLPPALALRGQAQMSKIH